MIKVSAVSFNSTVRTETYAYILPKGLIEIDWRKLIAASSKLCIRNIENWLDLNELIKLIQFIYKLKPILMVFDKLNYFYENEIHSKT